MRRHDWVWAFAKAFGIWLLAQALRCLATVVNYITGLSEGQTWATSFLLHSVLTFAIALIVGLILLFRTDWMMWFTGVNLKTGEDKEDTEEPVLSTPEGRKVILWAFLKALGIYLAFMAIIQLPIAIWQWAITLEPGGGYVSYSFTTNKMFSEALSTYIQLGVGVCLIIFTGFFVRLVTRYGILSGLKDKIKYAGGEE